MQSDTTNFVIVCSHLVFVATPVAPRAAVRNMTTIEASARTASLQLAQGNWEIVTVFSLSHVFCESLRRFYDLLYLIRLHKFVLVSSRYFPTSQT